MKTHTIYNRNAISPKFKSIVALQENMNRIRITKVKLNNLVLVFASQASLIIIFTLYIIDFDLEAYFFPKITM